MNDHSLSKVAKEEQYRHAEEDMNQQPPEMTHALKPSGQQTECTLKEGYHNVGSFQTKPFQQEGIILTQQQILEDVSGISPTYPGYEQLPTAQQITQEHLKRDKHLWTLLRSKHSQQVEDSGISDESGISTSNSKHSRKTNIITNGDSYRTKYEHSSALNSSTQESCSKIMDSSAYKFKHIITKRFSQEANKINKSDTSSSSSREVKRNDKLKRKIWHIISRSPSSSGSSIYPVSSSSNNNSSSRGGIEKVHEGKKSQDVLPGFILHPNGTHYIPLSIHPSSAGANIFNKSRCTYHPISISVNFGGPVLHMKKVSVVQIKTEDAAHSSKSMDSPSRCGSTNYVGNSSDSSPTPEQGMNTPGYRC